MPGRRSVCRECGRRWPQAGARFCGGCGAALATTSEPGRVDRRTTAVALRVLGTLGVVGLLAAVATSELTPSTADPTVRLDERPPTQPSPLSDDEAERLRAQVDPGRLDCEPRGCERWRLDLDTIPGHDPSVGVVEVADDVLVLHAGRLSLAEVRDLGHDVDEAAVAHRVIAIDPTTGAQHWEHPVFVDRDAERRASGSLRLQPGPYGPVIVTATTVTAIDGDGEVLWEHLSEWPDAGDGATVEGVADGDTNDDDTAAEDAPSGDGASVDAAWIATFGDTIVVQRQRPGGDDRVLVALDAATGRPQWQRVARAGGIVDDVMAVIDDRGRLVRLDVTGAPSWEVEGPFVGVGGVGAWLVATRDDGSRSLVDPDSGSVAATITEPLVAGPVAAEDGLVAVIHTEGTGSSTLGALDTSTSYHAVRFDDAGAVSWVAGVPGDGPRWHCCEVDVDAPTVAVTLSAERHVFDLGTGEHRATEEVTNVAMAGRLRTPWIPLPGGIEARWTDDLRHIDLRAPDGEATITGRRSVEVASFDPPIVADREHLMAVRLVDRG